MLKYKTINQNKLNLLYIELQLVRDEIKLTFQTPKRVLPDLQKSFRLEGLNDREDFILQLIAKEKGLLNFSKN